jgi:hypothetical protein
MLDIDEGNRQALALPARLDEERGPDDDEEDDLGELARALNRPE